MRRFATMMLSPPRPAGRWACLATVALLTACATPPQTHWHTLLPATLSGSKTGADGDRTHPKALPVTVAPVRLPAQVDRVQWLVRLPDDGVALLEQEQWASPLGDEIRLALQASLAARGFAIDPSASANAASPTRLSVEVRRFESLPGREARISGSWTLASTARAEAFHCDFLYREAATEGGFSALARAHVRAIERLSDAVAERLENRAACPAPDRR